jgi:hypothetical protein
VCCSQHAAVPARPVSAHEQLPPSSRAHLLATLFKQGQVRALRPETRGVSCVPAQRTQRRQLLRMQHVVNLCWRAMATHKLCVLRMQQICVLSPLPSCARHLSWRATAIRAESTLPDQQHPCSLPYLNCTNKNHITLHRSQCSTLHEQRSTPYTRQGLSPFPDRHMGFCKPTSGLTPRTVHGILPQGTAPNITQLHKLHTACNQPAPPPTLSKSKGHPPKKDSSTVHTQSTSSTESK